MLSKATSKKVRANGKCDCKNSHRRKGVPIFSKGPLFDVVSVRPLQPIAPVTRLTLHMRERDDPKHADTHDKDNDVWESVDDNTARSILVRKTRIREWHSLGALDGLSCSLTEPLGHVGSGVVCVPGCG